MANNISTHKDKFFFELKPDTVIGKQGKACLVTLDDRKSRFLIMEKSLKKQAKSVSKVMIKALEGVPVKTITPDRGKEFTDHASVTKALGGKQFYFPKPHQP